MNDQLSQALAAFFRAFCVLCGLAGTILAAPPEKVTYDDHIKPIFRQHCLACHDQDGRSGGLALDSYAESLTGGASGEVVDPGAGSDSRLYRLVAHLDKPIMPPGGEKIPAEQLELVKAWIDGGLLENAGSKAKKSQKAAVAAFVPTADNRPEGEPAMPSGFFREPVVHADRAGAVADLAASPWAPLVAIAGQRQVLLYHAGSHELLGVVPFLAGTPQVVRFSRNGDLLLVAGGRDASLGVVHLWDIRAGRRLAVIGDEIDTLLAADVSPDHALVATGGPRKRVQVYRTADGSVAYDLTKHTDWITALEFSPNGEWLVTADRSAGVHLWEARTGRPIAALAGHQAAITAVSWRRDSNMVATASEDGTVRLWQADGAPVRNWNAHGGGVMDVSFTKAGQLVTVGRDRLVKLFDGDGKELRQLATTDDLALSVAVTHDDGTTIVGDWTGQVRVVASADGVEVARLAANPPTLEMRIASTRQLLDAATTAMEPVQAKVMEVTNALADATETHQQHKTQQQAAREKLAAVQQQHQQQIAAVETQRAALAAAEEASQAAVAAREQLAAELDQLQTQLAAVANQQGEEADAEREQELETEISNANARLKQQEALHSEKQGTQQAAAAALAKAEQAAQQLSAEVAREQQAIEALAQAASELPSVDELMADRDGLQIELAKLHAAQQSIQQQLDALAAEQQAYQTTGERLAQQMSEQAAAAEKLSTELTAVHEQLAREDESTAAVGREIEALRQRIAELEQAQAQLDAIAEKTRSRGQEIEQQLDTRAGRRGDLERELSDWQEAQALQKKLAAGD